MQLQAHRCAQRTLIAVAASLPASPLVARCAAHRATCVPLPPAVAANWDAGRMSPEGSAVLPFRARPQSAAGRAATVRRPQTPVPHPRPVACRSTMAHRHRRPWPARMRAITHGGRLHAPPYVCLLLAHAETSACRARGDVAAVPPACVVGRSCVEVIATAESLQASGWLNAWPFRSNHSTRMPWIPAASSVSRNPSGTVPRSSPITIAPCRCDSSASNRSRSVSGIRRDTRRRRDPRPPVSTRAEPAPSHGRCVCRPHYAAPPEPSRGMPRSHH